MIGEKEAIRKNHDVSRILSQSDPIIIPHVEILKLEKILVNVQKFSHKVIKFAPKKKKKTRKMRGKIKDQVSFTKLYSLSFKWSPKILKNCFLKIPIWKIFRKPTFSNKACYRKQKSQYQPSFREIRSFWHILVISSHFNSKNQFQSVFFWRHTNRYPNGVPHVLK